MMQLPNIKYKNIYLIDSSNVKYLIKLFSVQNYELKEICNFIENAENNGEGLLLHSKN
jgi:hypothetical protein